ncbi:MAG: DUF4321 domain-containing protein [Oscillospiraceae bacterium]
MQNFKRTFAFVFFLLAGIVLGSFISYLCEGKAGLDWLAWGKSIGVPTDDPFVLDLMVLKISLGCMIKVTIAQIFTIALAIFAFAKTCKSI